LQPEKCETGDDILSRMQVLIIYRIFPCQEENHYTTILPFRFLNMSLEVVDVSLSARYEHISATIMDKQLMASKRLGWCETICLEKEAKIISYHVHHTAVPLESNSSQILSKQGSVTKPGSRTCDSLLFGLRQVEINERLNYRNHLSKGRMEHK
jgi:hypothetical protein